MRTPQFSPVAIVVALIAAAVGLAPPAGAATEWTGRNLPEPVTVDEVAFGDDTRGVAVGNGGAIFTTVDAGTTWTRRNAGTTANLHSAELLSGFCGPLATEDCIWVGGSGGTLLFSADSGATWCAQQTNTTATLHSLNSQGPNDVFGVGSGGTIIRSAYAAGHANARTCGAAAAYDVVPSGTAATLFATEAAQSAGGWYVAGAGGTILRVASVGPSAAEANQVAVKNSGTTADLFGIASNVGAVSERVTAVGAGGVVVSSLDAGPFSAQTSGTSVALRGASFIDDAQGFAVGDVGTILTTTNGGATWAKSISGTCLSLNAVDSGFVGAGPTARTFAAGERGTVLVDLGNATATQPDCSTFPTGANGYRMVAGDGGIFTFGARDFHGSTGDRVLNKPIVGGATDQSDYDGYWIVASDGGVFTFSAEFHGSLAGQALSAPAVEIEPTPSGKGYWIVQADGKVFAFGDAKHFGDFSGKALNQPVIGMSVTTTGQGYWLVAEDGGIFNFGDAEFFGSTGAMKLNAPVIDLAPAVDNNGYYLVAKDGGVFTFGSADFKGSTGDMRLNAPVIAMLVAPNGAGYWLAATDGGVFTFGAVDFLGSMGAVKLNSPVLDLIN